MPPTILNLIMTAVLIVLILWSLLRSPKVRSAIEHLEVKPDDAFFVSSDKALSPEAREAIHRAVSRFQNGELKVLVLDGGLTLTLVTDRRKKS